jgi:predicted DsbA family dithiol-disulfide isomerase
MNVPTASWGFLTYAGFALLAIAGIRRRTFPQGPGGLLFWGSIPAFCFGLFLMYIMATEVGSWCVNCLGLDAVNIGLVLCGTFAVSRRGVVPALLEDLNTVSENKPTAIAIFGGPVLAAVLVTMAYSVESTGDGEEGPPSIELPDGGFAPARGEINLEGAPATGPEDALITIVEFSDYQCPFCSAAHDEVRAVMEEHEDQVRFIHFHNPLDMACNPAIPRPFHSHACVAAAAAICAQRQGRFWPMNDLLFEHGRDLDDPMIRRLAERAELDWDRLENCMRSDSTRERILHDLEEGLQVPVEGTPTFLINGRVVSGFRPGLYHGVLGLLLENEGRWPE